MEVPQNLGTKKEAIIPSLIRAVEANEIVGFDDNSTRRNVLYELKVCFVI